VIIIQFAPSFVSERLHQSSLEKRGVFKRKGPFNSRVKSDITPGRNTEKALI
jgi:hypothetical protein